MNDQAGLSPGNRNNGLMVLATAILTVAVMLQLGVTVYHGNLNRQALHSAIAAQETPLAEALKVRQQLNSLAGKTVALAQQGNESAAAIIEKMAAAGVTFSSTAATEAKAPE